MDNLHVLNATGSLDQFINDIRSEYQRIIEKATKVLPIEELDVVVYDNSESVIEEYGIGGFTETHIVWITIDPHNKNSNLSFKDHFAQILAHELHHVARLQALHENIIPRLEAAVFEGLAGHFVLEITGAKPAPWDIALTGKELEKFIKLAKADRSTDYLIHDWLFGSKDNNIPKWAGYSVGFYLVSKYLKNHADKKASSLYKTPAEDLM